ncbi:head maturation protease, ClpP-related [Corynebacterium variabile]|uniref:head maturation protease, ClpP-related n=1 Tax=Corynebacterium variabile TaxID=1727 RepID=UPI002FE3AA59
MSEVLLYGEIGWECTASDMVRQVQDAEGDLLVRVNSPGGDVYDGLAIMNALRAHDGTVTAVVEGLAASAASFIVVGGADRVVVRPTAEIMIHDAMSFVGGNAAEMLAAITDLERISDNLASIYADRAGGDAAEWRDRMKAETWFSAQEAVDAGLADAVEDGRPAESGRVPVSALSRTRVAAKFRYQGRRAAPAPDTTSPPGHERKESHVSALADLAREMGQDENKMRAALGRFLNEEVTLTSTIDITYPAGSTVVPTGSVTVEPGGGEPTPPGLVFAVGEAPEGWSAEVEETTGVLTVTAPAGAEPDEEVTVTVTVTGNDEPVELPVTITVKSASGEGDDATAEETVPAAPEQVTLDMDTYRDLQAAAKLGWEAKATADKQGRADQVDTWIREGRINAAHRAKVITAMEKNEQAARDLYGNIPKNTIPVREIGHGQDSETTKAGARADLDKRAAAVFGRRSTLY